MIFIYDKFINTQSKHTHVYTYINPCSNKPEWKVNLYKLNKNKYLHFQTLSTSKNFD